MHPSIVFIPRAPAHAGFYSVLASAMHAALAATALAQSQPPVGNKPAQADVTVLSPFEVNVNEDTGYQAQSTLSGSRLNTRLKDTAAPISVFTDELLRDLGVTSFLELAEWAVGASPDIVPARRGRDEPVVISAVSGPAGVGKSVLSASASAMRCSANTAGRCGRTQNPMTRG